MTLFSSEEAAFRMVNTVSTVSFKRMRTEKATLIFSKRNTVQAAVRTISQTVRRVTLGTMGKALRLKSTAHLTNPDLVLSWSKVEKRLRELIKNDRYLNEKEKDHYADYLESEEAPQYEIDTQRKMARQRFIDANRDLPPADKRDTLALRLSDFIRDLDGYEKDLLSENVERTDLADVTAEQMEQHLADPATVQQLIDFLTLVQGKTADVYSRSNAWRFSGRSLWSCTLSATCLSRGRCGVYRCGQI